MENERPPRFWELARCLVSEAQRQGLVAPGFRTPPRLPGVVRSVRRYPSGTGLVAVACRDRPPAAVLGDMVEGLLLVNGLTGNEAAASRRRLWESLAPEEAVSPRPVGTAAGPPATVAGGPGGGTGQTRGA